MVAFLRITRDQDHHICVFRADSQHRLVIIYILVKILVEKNVVDQSVFQDRYYRFELFLDEKVVRAAVLFLRDHDHGLFKSGHDPVAFHRLSDILYGSELHRFLRIIEFIVCGHNDEDRRSVHRSYLLHRFDPVDAGHLDIHKCYVRTETLRKLDHLPSGLGRFHPADVREILLYYESERIDDYTLIIRKHYLIHPSYLPAVFHHPHRCPVLCHCRQQLPFPRAHVSQPPCPCFLPPNIC